VSFSVELSGMTKRRRSGLWRLLATASLESGSFHGAAPKVMSRNNCSWIYFSENKSIVQAKVRCLGEDSLPFSSPLKVFRFSGPENFSRYGNGVTERFFGSYWGR
jgi:hypothetical protein